MNYLLSTVLALFMITHSTFAGEGSSGGGPRVVAQNKLIDLYGKLLHNGQITLNDNNTFPTFGGDTSGGGFIVNSNTMGILATHLKKNDDFTHLPSMTDSQEMTVDYILLKNGDSMSTDTQMIFNTTMIEEISFKDGGRIFIKD